MKTLGIALLPASLLASGAVAAMQPTHLPANASQFYGLYQGQASAPAQTGVTGQDPRYPNDGLHPSPTDRASSWHF
jgi:hypothetical protein